MLNTGACPQQQHCFLTCSWPNAAYTVPLYSGYRPFPMYAEAAERGSLCCGAALGQWGCCCQVTSAPSALSRGAMNIYFFPGLGFFWCFGVFFPFLILNTSYLNTLLRLCPTVDAKTTVKMQRKERQ